MPEEKDIQNQGVGNKAELVAAIWVRLRDPKTATPEFVKLTAYLMTLMFAKERISNADKRQQLGRVVKRQVGPEMVMDLVKKLEEEQQQNEVEEDEQ